LFIFTKGDDGIVVGSYLENAAFNPSLSPFYSAIIQLVSRGIPFSNIDIVVLVESNNSETQSQILNTTIMCQTVAPKAFFEILKC
jgi:cytidine deaminase